MKICVVAYKFGTEQEIGEHLGTYHYFIEKMRRLVKLGHKVYVVAPWLSFWRRGSVDVDGVKVLRYFPPSVNNPKIFPLNRLINLWYRVATQRMIRQLDAKLDLSVIYVWQSRLTGYAVAEIKSRLRAPFLFRQITAWQWHLRRTAAQVYGKRVWYRSFLDPFLEMIFLEKSLQRKYVKGIYAKADRVVFVSEAASKEGLDMGLEPSKIAVIGVGVEADLFRPQNLEKKYDLLFIGRINFAEKGIGYLLQAMPEILNAVPDAKLGIVGGGGESQEMNGLIAQLGIKDHVELLGKKPFTELPKYLNESKVFVMPSVWMEHFGQVTIEAMACGVPVVGTNIGGTPEIVHPSLTLPINGREAHKGIPLPRGEGQEEGECGIIVPAKDSSRLAEAIVKLLQNDRLRERMGSAARKRVQENFIYEVLVNKFLELITSIGT